MSGQILHLVSNDRINYTNQTMTIEKIPFGNNIIELNRDSDVFVFEHLVISNEHFDLTKIKFLIIESNMIISKIPFKILLKCGKIIKKNNKIYINIQNHKFLPKHLFCINSLCGIRIKLESNEIIDSVILLKKIYLDTEERRLIYDRGSTIPVLMLNSIQDFTFLETIGLYFDLNHYLENLSIFKNNEIILALTKNDILSNCDIINESKCFCLFFENFNISNTNWSNEYQIKINNEFTVNGTIKKIDTQNFLYTEGFYFSSNNT